MFINILLTKTWIPLASKMNFKGARGLTRKITLLIDLYLPRSLERRQGIELLRIKFSSFPVYNDIDLIQIGISTHYWLPQIRLIILNNLFNRQILCETY